MATKNIGSGGDYTTIAAWSAYVIALGTLTEDEVGILTDDTAYARGARGDLDFAGVTLSGFTITLRATTNKHDGDFGNGARVEGSASFAPLYDVNQCIIEDVSFYNTESTNNGHGLWVESSSTLKRVIIKNDSPNASAETLTLIGSSTNITIEAVRTLGGAIGLRSETTQSSTTVSNVSVINATTGIQAANTHNGTIKNAVAYNCTTDWSGTFSGTYSNNASEDGTHPTGSGGNVTLTGNPFDADGYTPATSGELDGAGTDLSISLDAANNSFDATPSIGAYEDVGSETAPLVLYTVPGLSVTNP